MSGVIGFLIIVYCLCDCMKKKILKYIMDCYGEKKEQDKTKYYRPWLCIVQLVSIMSVIILLIVNRFIIKDEVIASSSLRVSVLLYIMLALLTIHSLYETWICISDPIPKEENTVDTPHS